MAPVKLCLNRDFHAALYPGAICSIPHCSANATAKPAVLPHWSHGDGRLPDGRLTRPLPQRLPRATGMRRGVNAGTAQRAGDGGRVYLANRHPRTQILKSVKSLESLAQI
eukprot:scaffold923_cov66-Phaeocystis_antarctica.AAC.2